MHRLGFAPNRAARQLVTHGHVTVNGRECNIPSMLLKAGDTVRSRIGRAPATGQAELQENPPPPPDYLERTGAEPPEGRVMRLPTRGDVDPRIQDIREQLIIEFCSR